MSVVGEQPSRVVMRRLPGWSSTWFAFLEHDSDSMAWGNGMSPLVLRQGKDARAFLGSVKDLLRLTAKSVTIPKT